MERVNSGTEGWVDGAIHTAGPHGRSQLQGLVARTPALMKLAP
jgi:hypothetical protein